MTTEKENNNYVMCLNDMGGGVMNVSVKVCNTLRAQSHNHEPVVVFNEDDNTDKFKAVTEVGGVDLYNLTMTGDKAKTLTASREDNEHIPCVLIMGFDAYNQAVTGNVSKALTNKATDSDHIPIVAIMEKSNDEQ